MSSKVPHNAHAWASDSETLVFKNEETEKLLETLVLEGNSGFECV